MTDVSAQQFLEILKDPTMSQVKARCMEMIKNPNNYIIDVTTSCYDHETTEVTIKLRLND